MTGRVNDLAGKLTRDERRLLDQQLIALDETHDVACVIAIVPWLQRVEVDTYARGLAGALG
jgi:uncharacterized membrane protein YgcG